MGNGRSLRDFGGVSLIFCLLLGLVFAYVVLRPFVKIFVLALVLAIISRPAYSWILRRTRGKASLSALLTCILTVLLLILPCIGILGLLAQQSVQLYQWVDERVSAGHVDTSLIQRVLDWQQQLFPQLHLDEVNIGDALSRLAEAVSKILVNLSTGAIKAATSTIWQFFLMLFALFYFIRDGEAFLRWAMHLTPLPASLEQEIFRRFRGVSESAFYGTFLTALAQGFLGGIGFLLAGLPPLVWGVIMAFFSMIPVVGTAIVWGPAAILLILSHKLAAGVFLIAWGVLVVGMSDNIIRPLLMRGKSELHPLLIFFSIIGGISAFGLLGILLGPLAVVLVIALLQAYERAARQVLQDLDNR